jgi:hypothetical protein
MASRDPLRFSLRQLLVAIFGFALLLSFCSGGWYAVSAAREAARQMSEQNNFRQVALGLHSYVDANGAFPPACIRDAKGRAHMSWRVSITPFLMSHNFYSRYDRNKPWDDPANDGLSRAHGNFIVYGAPGLRNADPAFTNIVMPTGPGTVGEGVKLSDITDDYATTILLLPLKPSDIPWHEPRDLDISDISRAPGDPNRILIHGRLFTGGFAAMVDGSVVRLPEDLPYDTLMTMLTIAGGETVEVTR